MKKIGQGAITTGGGTLVYTVPTGIRTEIFDVNVSNTTSGALTCLLHFVPVGGSATAANTFFPTISIPAYTMIHWKGVEVLNAGDFIQGIGSGAGLTVNITGNEYRA